MKTPLLLFIKSVDMFALAQSRASRLIQTNEILSRQPFLKHTPLLAYEIELPALSYA